MKRTLYLIFFIITSLSGFAQSLDQAKILYNEGNYEEAMPVFAKLVKQSPNNSSYNQWYGVCCYETGDYKNAEKYLLVAKKRNITDSYRYLAMLYGDLYRFEEAIEMWEEYIALLEKKKENTSMFEAKLEQIRNLKRMFDKAEDVQIIDSMVVGKDAFLKAYSLSEESGNLDTYANFFKSGKNFQSTVHTNQKGDNIFYARPSDNGAYSIYSQTKLLDAWGDEKNILPGNEEDNNYPFVLNDGVTMYFASKGNGSLGGYDIFVTRYNTSTNSFLAPEQLGMPYNSAANDYMMVIDETKKLGWFVSDRNQPEDMVCVYLFIPDPSRKRIESEGIEDQEIIKRRATLASIRETWKDGADYSALIKLSHTENSPDVVEKQRDFVFVVNDKITYYTLDEIKSHEARDLYAEVMNINKQIGNLRQKLEGIRESYTKGAASIREQLKPTILQAENQLNVLLTKSAEQEKKARNAEIRASGNK